MIVFLKLVNMGADLTGRAVSGRQIDVFMPDFRGTEREVCDRHHTLVEIQQNRGVGFDSASWGGMHEFLIESFFNLEPAAGMPAEASANPSLLRSSRRLPSERKLFRISQFWDRANLRVAPTCRINTLIN